MSYTYELQFQYSPFGSPALSSSASAPRFELVAYLNMPLRVPGSTAVRVEHERHFVSDSLAFLVHDHAEAASREVLSFPGFEEDLLPTFGPAVSWYAQRAVLGRMARLEATIFVARKAKAMRSGEEIRRIEAALEEERYCREGGACTCTVCLEEFGAGEKVARMPCSHRFHVECVRTWLVEESNSCPLCRYVIE